ncbi:MAG: hypothetical protein JXA90_04060, partial [Planctomycetes bacterium]|nr:hypothetical protein [Planctomycetota bacterium]
AQSKWIGPAADSNGSGGLHTFRIRMTIPDDLDASAMKLIGSWTSDNEGLGVRVNGVVAAGVVTDGNFAALHAFPDAAGLGLFQTGENLVEFLVNNAGAGPVGLRVEGVVGQGTAPGDLSTGHGLRGIGPLSAGFAEGRYSAEDAEGQPVELTVLAPAAGWLDNAAGSRWIGLGTDGKALTYTLSFDLGLEVNPDRVRLAGGWTSAPAGGEVLLNGVSLDLPSADPAALAEFPAAAGEGLFLYPTNTLTFVAGAPGEGEPAALRVDALWMQVTEANPFDISTGFDETSAVVLNPGDADSQYTLILPDATEVASTVITGAPIPPWIANSVSSAWIGGDAAGGNADPGEYVYRTTVALTADQAAEAVISGGFAADDSAADVRINGVSTGLATQSGFLALTIFPADFGLGLFQEGENTIEFVVSNGGEAANPSGLRVDAVVRVPSGGSQKPGDCTQDGNLDISDGICLLGYLYLGTPAVLPCEGGTTADEGNRILLDSNGDGNVDLTDAVRVFGYLFLGSPPPVLGTGCVTISGCPDACE